MDTQLVNVGAAADVCLSPIASRHGSPSEGPCEVVHGVSLTAQLEFWEGWCQHSTSMKGHVVPAQRVEPDLVFTSTGGLRTGQSERSRSRRQGGGGSGSSTRVTRCQTAGALLGTVALSCSESMYSEFFPTTPGQVSSRTLNTALTVENLVQVPPCLLFGPN